MNSVDKLTLTSRVSSNTVTCLRKPTTTTTKNARNLLSNNHQNDSIANADFFDDENQSPTFLPKVKAAKNVLSCQENIYRASAGEFDISETHQVKK